MNNFLKKLIIYQIRITGNITVSDSYLMKPGTHYNDVSHV